MGMQMKRLREHREARGFSREALAREAGVSAALIQAHEQGRNRDTHVSVAAPLARVLGISMEELFAPEDMGIRVKESLVSVESSANAV